jgi:methylamine---corrinoid protein Co-methyltransferase
MLHSREWKLERLNYVLDLSNSGVYLDEETWDLEKVAATTRKLVKKYGIVWDPGILIPEDPKLLASLFEAGIELASRLGVYIRDTHRIVPYGMDLIRFGLESMPRELTMGEGKDARILFARKVMDDRAPLIWGGSPGTSLPEDLFLAIETSYAQERNIDMLATGSLATVDGREVRTGTPLELMATQRELKLLRKTIENAGRPGMGLMGAESSVSAYGDLSVANPALLRSSDAHLIPMQNELKVDYTSLMKTANSIEYGMRNSSLACVIVGGLGGDAPGSAVLNIASFALSNLVCLADFHSCHPIHIRHVATTTRSVLWVESVVCQAFSQHAPCIIFGDSYPKSGALTKELLYEVAANAIVISVSGGHLKGPASADGLWPNCTGLEARWMGEIGQAVTRQHLDQNEANALVNKLINKYEHVFDLPEGNPGKPFNQAYDLETIQPRREWSLMYEEVKEEVQAMGLAALNETSVI